MFNSITLALCGSAGNTPATVVLDGDTLLGRLGEQVRFIDCTYSSDYVAAETMKTLMHAVPSLSNLTDFGVLFSVDIRSLATTVWQKAVTYTNSNGFHGFHTMFSLPFNGQDMLFALEIVFPDGEVDLNQTKVRLSTVGGA